VSNDVSTPQFVIFFLLALTTVVIYQINRRNNESSISTFGIKNQTTDVFIFALTMSMLIPFRGPSKGRLLILLVWAARMLIALSFVVGTYEMLTK
jgi:hypothetical protein